MKTQMVLCGIGGQGVLFATKLLAITAMRQGDRVFVAETHGMSQRGGAVVSHLKIGPFASPLVRKGTANYLIGFELQEVYRNLHFIQPGLQTLSQDQLVQNTGATPVEQNTAVTPVEQNTAVTPVEQNTNGSALAPLGGVVYVNSAAQMPATLQAVLRKYQIQVRALDADQVAVQLKAPVVANLVLLGFAAAYTDFPLPLEELVNTAASISPPHLRALNIQALQQGQAAV